MSMTDKTALDLAIGFLDASLGERDFDRAATYLADDFTFEGPIDKFDSAEAFLAGFKGFASMLQPGWRRLAAYGHGEGALVMYEMFGPGGAPIRAVDSYTAKDGKLDTLALVFDTHGLR
jgi:hypothetical protein